MKSVHAVVSGRVQGVWFRAWTAEKAQALGLDGWVRNRRDGTVEAVFGGDEAAVDEMVVACGKGPPLVRVTGVVTEPCEPPDVGFATRPTE